MVKITVEYGDVLTFNADILALKYAQAFHGADRVVSERLTKTGNYLPDSLPCISESVLIGSEGSIAAKAVLLVGVQPLSSFGYPEIREFARLVLAALVEHAPKTEHLCLTVHGPGYGLDEKLAFEAEIAGILDAIHQEEYPRCLKLITVVERDKGRAERLKSVLHQQLPRGGIGVNSALGGRSERIASLYDGTLQLGAEVLFNLDPDRVARNEQASSQQLLRDLFDRSLVGIDHLLSVSSKCAMQADSESAAGIVGELQSRAIALGALFSLQSLNDAEAVVQLAITALAPLQASIEVAQMRLRDLGQPEVGLCCYVMGTGALVAGLGYLEQDTDSLRGGLQNAIDLMRVQMLNKIALALIPKNEFPWTRVAHFLSLAGAGDLLELYRSIA